MNPSATAKKPINDWMYEQTRGIVQTGPFAGMVLPADESWSDGNLSTKLLGCYEEELHPFVEREIARLVCRSDAQIVDVGCADGYYAVGLAMRLPKSTVFAVDISPDSLHITAASAERNCVGSRVATTAPEEVFASPDLVIVDCEGSEVLYLDLDKSPLLRGASIIVECHDFDEDRSITSALVKRFSDTHAVQEVQEGPRDPNKFKMLRCMHSLDRWLAVSEGRPCTMHWLVMTPYQPRAPQ